jgi:hypothetical protein
MPHGEDNGARVQNTLIAEAQKLARAWSRNSHG